MAAYLRTGDVVLPQLTADPDGLASYAGLAADAGARFIHVLVRDPAVDPAARFRRRAGAGPADPWHDAVRRIVDTEGGDVVVERYSERLAALLDRHPGTLVVDSVEGDEDATYEALVGVVSAG